MFEIVSTFWPEIVAATHVAAGLAASAHVVLYKDDERSAVGWVGVIWLTPLLGSLLYVLFGVNRIRRRAQLLRAIPPALVMPDDPQPVPAEELRALFGEQDRHFEPLVRLVGELTGRPLLSGNALTPLGSGDSAYPAMLESIRRAERSVALSTYIFDNDRAGALFLDALRDAAARGVAVRVLIDDVGSRYTWPSIVHLLRRASIPVATFNPNWVPGRLRYANLRNHRKILVADGGIGFTGGMNIREGHLLSLNSRHPVRDLHFRVEGPVVRHLQEAFVIDWAFTTGERLEGEVWFSAIAPAGAAMARGISDGPDEDFDKLRLTLLGALATAQRRVDIVTPYFLPDPTLITALEVAAMRGVEVNVLLPEVNNLRMVQWASTALLPAVLEHGCRVWLAPPPFDHTKLMLVDRAWALVGSANWDPRSLRLNFEFNVECYDPVLVRQLEARLAETLAQSRRVTLDDLDRRPLPVRLRDGIIRLAAPYL